MTGQVTNERCFDDYMTAVVGLHRCSMKVLDPFKAPAEHEAAGLETVPEIEAHARRVVVLQDYHEGFTGDRPDYEQALLWAADRFMRLCYGEDDDPHPRRTGAVRVRSGGPDKSRLAEFADAHATLIEAATDAASYGSEHAREILADWRAVQRLWADHGCPVGSLGQLLYVCWFAPDPVSLCRSAGAD